MVIRAIDAVKCLPTSTTATSISSTRDASTRAIASFRATCVRVRSRNATVCAFTFCMCTKNIDRTSVPCVARALVNRRAWTNTCAFTAASDRTNVSTATRHSPPRAFYAPTLDNILARNHSRYNLHLKLF